jgi:tetratricopeptide (TPR) repeat protein
MPVTDPSPHPRIPTTGTKHATAPGSRASSLRLIPLLCIGLALIGAAWALRSSAWLHETIVRSKDMAELEAMVRAKPDDAIAQYYLGRRYYVAGRYADAAVAYDAAARLDPNSARSHLGLGLSLFEQGRLNEARVELEQTLRLTAGQAPAEYTLGKIAWMQHNIPEALPHLLHATQIDPKSAPAWYGLAVCEIQAQQRDKALEPLQHAVAIDPGNASYQTALGELLCFFGRMDEGRACYERALQLSPDYGPACALAGQFYLRKVGGPAGLARAEELLTHATRTRTYHPEEVYLDLGELYMRKQRYPDAVEALQRSIHFEPRDERPYYLLTKVYRRMGDRKELAAAEQRFQYISRRHVQMQSLQALLSHSPNDAVGHLQLAHVYSDLDMMPQAADQYAAYLRLKPDDAAAMQAFRQAASRAQSESAASQQQPLDLFPQLPSLH